MLPKKSRSIVFEAPVPHFITEFHAGLLRGPKWNTVLVTHAELDQVEQPVCGWDLTEKGANRLHTRQGKAVRGEATN